MHNGDLTDQIRKAFAGRPRPHVVTDRSRPPITDRQDAERLEERGRDDLDWWFLQRNADALYAMTPDAFRYYLPEFMVLGIAKSSVSPLFISPVFQMLDPGPDARFWSDSFRRHWAGMTTDEYEAVKAWVVTMASDNPGWVDDVVLSRAFDTLICLSEFQHELP